MIKKPRGLFLLTIPTCLLLASWLVVGCVGVIPMTSFDPTNTPTLTRSPTPLPTDTPTPSPTPAPSSTPTLTPTLALTPTRDPLLPLIPTPVLGEREQVDTGGFAYRDLVDYEVRVQGNQVSIFNDENGFAVSLNGFTVPRFGSIDDLINALVRSLGERFTEFASEPPFPYTVAGHEGRAAIVHGDLEGEDVTGMVVIVAPSDTQLLYAIAMLPDTPEGSFWQRDGWPVLDVLLSTIEFFPPTPE